MLNSEDTYDLFGSQHQFKRIQIISNNICYGLAPLKTDEVEQHLTITANGEVWFSGYNYGEECGKYTKARTKKFRIDKQTANHILSLIGSYFSRDYETVFATDIGDWTLTIIDENDKVLEFKGLLNSFIQVDEVDLSDLIRDTLGIDNLYVFDGDNKPDIVEKISIAYHRVTKFKPKISESEGVDLITWDYSEHLVIDRGTETLEHIQRIGPGCIISKKYYVEEGILILLDNIDAENFLKQYKVTHLM